MPPQVPELPLRDENCSFGWVRTDITSEGLALGDGDLNYPGDHEATWRSNSLSASILDPRENWDQHTQSLLVEWGAAARS